MSGCLYVCMYVCIRALGFLGSFSIKARNLVERNSQTFFTLQNVQNWIGLILDFIAGLISLIVAVTVVLQSEAGNMTPEMAGLALLYSFSLGAILKQLVRFWADLEAKMNCIERIRYYTDCLPIEGMYRFLFVYMNIYNI